MRLDIRTAPSTRMMYSVSRRTSFRVVPSGETVWSSSSKGFTDVMLQQVDYWTSGAGFHLFALIALTENAAGDKKKGACKVTSALVQLKSSDTSGITSFSTSASIEARTIFIMRNPEMSTNTGEPICQAPNIRGTACTVRYNPAGLRLACRLTVPT